MQPLFLRALKAQLVLLITSMMFITTGCEDDLHDEDHTDAEGFILENESGTEVYKEFKGAIITNNLTLSVGDTLELSVHFLDHDGEEIEHEEEEEEDHGEDEDELRITENDESIAIVEAEKHEEGEEEHHEMAIHVIGVSAGSTEFKLELMHDEHADYISTNNVPVTVTSGN